jgi:LAS superfamily LD-carboxypeptidase LdcB
MKDFIQKIFTKQNNLIILSILCLTGVLIGYSEYRRAELEKQIIIQTKNLASTTLSFSGGIKGLEDQITNIVAQNNLLNNTVQTQIAKSTNLADQLGQVNDTAVALDKLSKVDPQLLQKYSKVYFLNENYVPAPLINIPGQFGYYNSVKYQLLDGVEQHLVEMLTAAEKDGISMKVISAYRSFGTQAILKSGYNVTFGAGTANQFSAEQGYSEHQLGTTIDFTTQDLGAEFDTFDATVDYTWLTDNAYKYGFILSYPKNNTYYLYEPWHWRFVGVDLANRLHRQGESFYGLDQKVINNYLGIFFD